MNYRNIQSGFTLIELAMVIFILGLLFSSFLAPLAARVEQQERNNTQIQLNEIEETLYGHVLQNNYLPCPDCASTDATCGVAAAADPDQRGDGVEDTIASGGGKTCASETGNLPWVTLGVKGTDEWNNIFTYRVDSRFADRNNATTDGTPLQAGCVNTSATLNVSFSLCSDGNITVRDLAIGGSPVASFVPAIVVSHGKNWAASTSADEAENTDGDTIFVDKDYSQTDGSEFDDILIWISPYVLRAISVKAGILP